MLVRPEPDTREDFERAIISFAVSSPGSEGAFAYARTQLNDSDFENLDYRRLFTLFSDLQDGGIDLTDSRCISLALKNAGFFDAIGGNSGISKLAAAGYAASNLHYYVKEILRLSKLSTLKRAAAQVVAEIELDANAVPEQLIAGFECSVQQVASPTSTVRTLAEAAEIALDHQRKAAETGIPLGMPTGFPDLDLACGGFFKGQLTLLSGRSYVGKTTLALNIAKNLATKGKKVVFHCLEMKDFELAELILAMDADIELEQFAQGDFTESDFARAETSIQHFKKLPIWLPDSTSETVSKIAGKARYHKATYGLDVLFIDHLQRLSNRSKDQKRYETLIEDTRYLKNLARELDCVVVLLTQLNGGADDDTKPTDVDYAEAKNIRQEADLAMMLHRTKSEPYGTLILNKVRKGCASEVRLEYEGKYRRFTSASNAWIPG